MTTTKILFFVVTLCSCLLIQADASRILGFFPSPSKSHLMIHLAIADKLAEAGHDVTVIATQDNLYKHAKYQYIQIAGLEVPPNFANKMINDPQPMYKTFKILMDTVLEISSQTLTYKKMQTFLKEHGEGSFDLLIVGYFMNDFHLGLAGHFKCPLIVDFMVRPAFGLNGLIGNPSEAAYTPALFTGLRQPMSFFERVLNFLAIAFEDFVIGNYMNYQNEKYYNLHFPADRYPPLSEVKKNISLILTNHHTESQGPIRPNVPALVEIGGIQIKEKPNPLPKDIAEAVDQAKQGFIYFSLGTVVQGTFLPRDKVKLMFDVLSKLPYLVIWKWGEGENPGKADNIIYRAWLPQDDILAHPNCKLFITHGGQGGVVESQYHGVPMVGIPFFGDQPTNMKNVVASQFGLSLDYLTLSADKFEQTIKEVLNNPKYSTAVKQYSKLYRDRPMTPRQLVVYWVEYVIRHHGAPHLQSPAVFMNRWQLLSLDVIGFILAVLAIVVGALVVTCRLCCCRGRSKAKQFNKVKKNK